MSDDLLPVPGCWVRDISPGPERFGIVKVVVPDPDGPQARVAWLKPQRIESSIALNRLGCAFKLGMEVLEASASARLSLGQGEIIRLRTLGGREQALVEFPESGQRMWLPYQNLRQVKGVRHRYFVGDRGDEHSAERFRLRVLAHALEIWNENTGALSRLDIDPLPHQIHLVHHILASGNLNWLIADDVGLGKTIETGMLMAALRQRELLGRVLLVTPAGLTRQWKDELYFKFGFEDFAIYGEDFHVNEPREWKMHDFVIGSMDRLKGATHLESLMQAEPWDLVIFDEGHRLSRRQYGMRYDYSDRFQLAQALRPRTRSMLLLSGTPHQGDQSKFVGLLELLRPERKEELEILALNPEIIGEMVYRNYKADVTDAEGKFVFHGKLVNAIRMDLSEEARAFDIALQAYLRRGYDASRAGGDRTLRAIGFVMTTYRKLAASSSAAILTALRKRLARLQKENLPASATELNDARYIGEWEESQVSAGPEFFDGELSMLGGLIAKAEALKAHDLKRKGFLDTVIDRVLEDAPDQKVLIFTEYRSTQEYLREALADRYGSNKVELIHGSMDHPERRASIARFEDGGQFLISTEAGGEGINLQRRCHVMVNYDLPWNPMRLVQRVGRLYRYGQTKRVIVFNLHASGTVDEDIIELMYERLNQVVADLVPVQRHEFTEAFKDDVLGEIAELLDMESILTEATQEGITRTQERIDEALARARGATEKQRELFQHAARYDAAELSREFKITEEHLLAFVYGMFVVLNVEVTETLHQGRVIRVRLPDALRDQLKLSGARMDLTLDRLLAANRPNTHMLDLSSPLMKHLLTTARHHDFGGLTAAIGGVRGQAILATLLRWQDDQGRRMRQSFDVFGVTGDKVEHNPEAFGEWLLKPAVAGTIEPERTTSEALMKVAEVAAHQSLAATSNRYLHPENMQWAAAAWVEPSRIP